MIARLQTTFLLLALLYGAACLVWWWPQQPLWAVLVALLPLWGLAAVLAVELVLMQRLNRRDGLWPPRRSCFGRGGMRWVRPC